MLYGKPVLSIQQAAQKQVKLILVAARPGSCRVIAKRMESEKTLSQEKAPSLTQIYAHMANQYAI